MIALLALASAQLAFAAPSGPPTQAAPPANPPHDWTQLPAVTLPPATPEMIRFVRDEVEAGRCSHPHPADGQVSLVVPLALHFSRDGGASGVVPLAIGCPTIEQFSAGAALRMMRQKPFRAMPAEDHWYRSAITYTWSG
ncbi:hypothetical protein RN629_08760 [Sphingomonadaceae bacterium jetA1]|jgi:hypothetical protein|uniref:hypothetical protein n=1 Tax=Facivitalis istanbulensis TaxID=3075838 RepID=UPI003476E7AF